MTQPYIFAANPLDGGAKFRTDPEWLQERVDSPDSRFLPMWKLNVLVKKTDPPSLAWARKSICGSMDSEVGPVLLGLNDGVAHFVVDISSLEEPEKALGLGDLAEFEDVRTAVVRCPDEEWGMVAQARALVDWHATHRFCSTCGAKSVSEGGGSLRRCPQCNAEHFPRVNPVVIMLVHAGERCLLGRQSGWPRNMFSALAGFVEAGETIEEAVRREVSEEAGVRVGAVRYHSTQPWPFPSSLMIGCIAEAESEDIVLDDHELEEARWFSREQIRAALNDGGGQDPVLPSPLAVAHHLLRAWAL